LEGTTLNFHTSFFLRETGLAPERLYRSVHDEGAHRPKTRMTQRTSRFGPRAPRVRLRLNTLREILYVA
jgi:hypothetical protein